MTVNAFINEAFTGIKNRYLSWCSDQAVSDANIADTALDTLNRAQKKLWEYADWDNLVSDYPLSLNTGLVASLPSDYGKTLAVFHDSDADGRPDFWYWRDADQYNGYLFRDAWTAAAGHVFTMQFHESPAVIPVYLRYMKALADFTGTGTEYSFYPGELLLLRAQVLHLTESGNVGTAEYESLKKEYQEQLRDYVQAHQFRNSEQKIRQLDFGGQPIMTDQYNLNGGSERRGTSHFNDMDDSRAVE